MTPQRMQIRAWVVAIGMSAACARPGPDEASSHTEGANVQRLSYETKDRGPASPL